MKQPENRNAEAICRRCVLHGEAGEDRPPLLAAAGLLARAQMLIAKPLAETKDGYSFVAETLKRLGNDVFAVSEVLWLIEGREKSDRERRELTVAGAMRIAALEAERDALEAVIRRARTVLDGDEEEES
jgi:hypothetical protein